MLKRGFRSLLQQPEIFLMKISKHFYFILTCITDLELKKAIQLVNSEDREEFFNYVNYSTSYNPHIMFIAKPSIANKWFEAVFSWLLSVKSFLVLRT